MVNPSRNKGTKAETALVRWLNVNGFPGADRAPLRGSRDTGDLTGMPDLVVSVKFRKQGGQMDWSGWLRDVDRMRANAALRGADPAGLLVVRRTGYPSPGDWYAVQSVKHWVDTFHELLT